MWKPNIGAKKTTASKSGLTDKEKESILVEQSDKNIGGKKHEGNMQKVTEPQEANKDGTEVVEFTDSPNEIPKDHSNTYCKDRIKATNDEGQDRTEDEDNLKQPTHRNNIDGELPIEDDLNQHNQQKQNVVFEPVITNTFKVLHADLIEENVDESMRKEDDSEDGLLVVGMAGTLKHVDAKKQLMIEITGNFEKILAQVAKGEEPEFISAH
ncbi:OLC1v1025044C1 [Oldenlandia corymbosa var. corymbosa]|uniref:OLC1v1025044C1 n=1 Tax=Oldenlandia corymbosa var. corymbosa TaxID=529605 RepID=A0AAV1C647_OLDCO|nr:OLC1v1025044C1 [Oldenlandia corymbosa var. corymbosa]